VTSRRILGVVGAVAILGADITPAARHALRVPAQIQVAVGQEQALLLDLPGLLGVRASAHSGLAVDGSALEGSWLRIPAGRITLEPEAAGTVRLHLRLFGFLPWRTLRVQAVSAPVVSTGGESVAVAVRSKAPLVVAVGGGRIPGVGGGPAERAGIRPGDYILAADGQPVSGATALSEDVADAGAGGQPLRLLVQRHGHEFTVTVHPERADGRYLIGAWVRDTATGIGTLTFQGDGVFGALGHPVTDTTTGTPILLGSGQLLESRIAGIEPSSDGHPGEKVGTLIPGSPTLGVVLKNTGVGVFGRLVRPWGPLGPELPIALEDQVQPGPAEILTVVQGTRIQAYSARIDAVLPQRRGTSKGVVITITDPRLLAATGGIVQGMSGSPIVQDGRLVGAVTHVLVDNPRRGYGVLAIWMAAAAGLVPSATGV
jgi:stage IV sporulation protein B